MSGLFQRVFNKIREGVAAEVVASNKAALGVELKKRGHEMLAVGRLFEAGQCFREATVADPRDSVAFTQLGYVLGEQKRWLEASTALEEAVMLDANQHDAQFLLGKLAQQQGKFPQAIHRFREALRTNPQSELAYDQLSMELLRTDSGEAGEVIRSGLEKFPDSTILLSRMAELQNVFKLPLQAMESPEKQALIRIQEAPAQHLQLAATHRKPGPPRDSSRCTELKKRGNAFLSEGNLAEAGKCYLEASHADPEDAFALINLGYALMEQKRLAEASSALEEAVLLDPTQFDAHFMLGTLAQQQGNMPRTIFRFQEALKLNPDFETLYRDLGYELFRNDQTTEAKKVIEDGIARFPQSSDLLCNLGSLYSALNEPQKAVDAYSRALALDPGSARIIGNLGAAYDLLGDWDKAGELMLKAMAIDPTDMDHQTNMGMNFLAKGRTAEAIKCYETTLMVDPQHSVTHMNLGLASLMLGDYERGWTEYQWRFKVDHDGTLKGRKTFPQPMWLGVEPIQGQTILLHCEQGFGDTLQFCRYANDVAKLGGTVLLQVQPGLKDVLSRLEGVARIFQEGEVLPPFDFHCPLMSLPLALGLHKSSAVPPEKPYIVADPQRILHWQQRFVELGAASGLPRVGVVWSGNHRHRRDRERSLAASEFLSALPSGMPFVCLQPQVRDSEVALVQADSRISFLGKEIYNFAETAALISNLDLVITVDTSVAHLAGALGKPVWVLVTAVPDWRWLLDRADSTWYANTRIFRQAVAGDWSQPLQQVHDALLQRYETATA